MLDPELGARECLRRLPPAFRDVTCGWQVSASGGYKLGWRLRTWHWLDHPCTGAELKTWLKPAVERNLLDPVTLLEPQPHYLAVTVRGGPDPCPRRFGLLRLAKDAVPVPDIARIKRWQQTREPAAGVATLGRAIAGWSRRAAARGVRRRGAHRAGRHQAPDLLQRGRPRQGPMRQARG